MKVLLNGSEKCLIPYNNNPSKWWDGTDESKIYDFSDLKFPTTTQEVTQVVTNVKIKTKAKGSIKKIGKNND